MRDLMRRIAKLEVAADLSPPMLGDNRPLKLIVIRGGLPDTLHATFGELRLDAMSSETRDAFVSRALDLAAEAGAPFVVVSGQPEDQCGNRTSVPFHPARVSRCD